MGGERVIGGVCGVLSGSCPRSATWLSLCTEFSKILEGLSCHLHDFNGPILLLTSLDYHFVSSLY